MTKLRHAYVSVKDGDCTCYGGCQTRSLDSTVRKCGCGAVAALDLLLYMERYHFPGNIPEFSFLHSLPVPTIDNVHYQILLKKLMRTYLPVIPPFGMTGLGLAAGLNVFFLKHRISYRAHWGVPASKTWREAEKMLNSDIPVIMAVGPNFPRFWQNSKLRFYSCDSSGQLHPSAEAKAHFISLTGIDKDLLQISSWGYKYYIKRNEFEAYVRQHSINYFSSILQIYPMQAE